MKLEPQQVRFIVKVLAFLGPFASWVGFFLFPYGGVNIANCLPFPDQTFCQNLAAGAPLSTLTSAAGAPINWPTVLVVPLGVLTFLSFSCPWFVAGHGRVDRYAAIPFPLGLVITVAPWFGLAPEWGYGVIIGLFWVSYVASLYYASLRQAESEAGVKAERQRRWAEDAAASLTRKAARAEAEARERAEGEARARAEAEARAAYQRGYTPPTEAHPGPRPPPRSPPPPRDSSRPPPNSSRESPPHSPPTDDQRGRYLEFMGLPSNSSKHQIHKRFRVLARRYHPDVWQEEPETAQDMTKKLNEAMEYLDR
jgi:DnaJ domain